MGSESERGCRCGLGAESGVRRELGRKWAWFGMIQEAENVLVTLYYSFFMQGIW